MKLITDELVQSKLAFIKEYVGASNAASGSKYDANANVTKKNIATLAGELWKDGNIAINRALMDEAITNKFGNELAEQYKKDLASHLIYKNDETSLKPYCTSVSLYPLLIDGMKSMGGESNAPTNLESFMGSLTNLIFALSSQFSGAVAAVEVLAYADHFARKTYGDNYLETHERQVNSAFQGFIYQINQPAAARDFQSVFFNLSIFDEFYFKSLFENFVFPDGGEPKWESVSKLQEWFLTFITAERERAVLTFPVITAAMLITSKGDPRDEQFARMCSRQLSKGASFFVYTSENADSLASCCRLRNEMADNTFSTSMGAGGVQTGSISVITLNVNRMVQTGVDVEEITDRIQKYQMAYRSIVEGMLESGMLPAYDAGYITLSKQFCTIGLNGLMESAESLGIDITYNQEYIDHVDSILSVIYRKNKELKAATGILMNTEIVPAESLGIKNQKWDAADGLITKRDAYNSYLYVVEDDNTTIVDKFRLHGKEMTKHLDGGSAFHCNLENYLDEEGFMNLIRMAGRAGCNYFCTNIKITCCEEDDCGHINKQTELHCVKCGSGNISHATRIIGYLKKITSFQEARKVEEGLRHYHEM